MRRVPSMSINLILMHQKLDMPWMPRVFCYTCLRIEQIFLSLSSNCPYSQFDLTALFDTNQCGRSMLHHTSSGVIARASSSKCYWICTKICWPCIPLVESWYCTRRRNRTAMEPNKWILCWALPSIFSRPLSKVIYSGKCRKPLVDPTSDLWEFHS